MHTLSKLLSIIVLFTVFSCSGDDGTVSSPSTPPINVDLSVINDTVNNNPIVIVGSEKLNLIVSFYSRLSDGTQLIFKPSDSSTSYIFTDEDGNIWDIFGKALAGPRKGQSLRPTLGKMAYWFIGSAFFPDLTLYNDGPINGTAIPPSNNPAWLLPTDFIFVGSGFNFIPSIDNPQFTRFNTHLFADYSTPHLVEDDLVSVITYNGITRVYPHSILNYHEVVNNEINGQKFVLSFCPLAGVSTAFETSTNYGVSGLLFNNDLIMYDHESNSNWLQLTGTCVNGSRINEQLTPISVLETTWSTAKLLGRFELLNINTGANYNYSINAYPGYRENNNAIPFPTTSRSHKLNTKERVHFVQVDGMVKAYRLSDFK